jgi:DTW domain-containing protein YfiP
MHVNDCICSQIPTYDLATRLVLVMHYAELSKASSSGVLALAALSHSELRVHGLFEPDRRIDVSDLYTRERRTLVLYPEPNAPALTPQFVAADPRPTTLVILDGTWRQAGRMRRRLPGLDPDSIVSLPHGPPSSWPLRGQHRSDSVSTLEAIARAFGILESLDVQRDLEKLLHLSVRTILASRGIHGS